ncbi:MAG: hypothetical protein WDW36_001688 [Sanguina aurantia]
MNGSRGTRHSRPGWTAEPPPFGLASARFNANDVQVRAGGSTSYHVAYRDICQPPSWTSKGWSGLDDAVKPGRGTSVGLVPSCMAPATAPPRYGGSLQPMAASFPNETRLQELLSLHMRRQQAVPGPGSYPVSGIKTTRKFRRPHDPQTDGPFLLGESDTPTRMREIAEVIRCQVADSGLSPGEYESMPSKDYTSHHAPKFSMGVADRKGRASHARALSISRNIQYGINYRIPVIVATASPAPAPIPDQPPSTAGHTRPPSPTHTAPLPRTHPQHQSAAHIQAYTFAPSRDLSTNDTPSLSAPGTAEADQQRGSSSSSSRGGGRQTSPPHDRAVPSGGGLAWGAGGGREGEAPTLSLGRRSADVVSPELVAVPPTPPSAVARGIRRDAAKAPGDWDWGRLGHNPRNNWTTLHGGAYSHGDKPVDRQSRSAPTGRSGRPAAVVHQPGRRQDQSAAHHHAAPTSGRSHANTTGNTLSSGIFPIREESSMTLGSAAADSARARTTGHLHDPFGSLPSAGGVRLGAALFWVACSTMVGLGVAVVAGGGVSQPMLEEEEAHHSRATLGAALMVSPVEVQRRQAAARAALSAGSVGGRQASWRERSSLV